MKHINEGRKSSFKRSSSDLYFVGHEQLFTELTWEQASVVVGGAVVEFSNIGILKSDAENICLYVNNKQVWSAPIDEKGALPVEKDGYSLVVSYPSIALIELYENCDKGSKGKLVGSFSIPASAVASDTKYLEGSKSEYLINYRVFD